MADPTPAELAAAAELSRLGQEHPTEGPPEPTATEQAAELMTTVMIVRRVHTEHASHIEPPFDVTWDDLTKLRWHAALITTDTGIQVTVKPNQLDKHTPDGGWQRVPDAYGVTVGGTSSGHVGFGPTWTYLNGVDTGAQEARFKTATALRQAAEIDSMRLYTSPQPGSLTVEAVLASDLERRAIRLEQETDCG